MIIQGNRADLLIFRSTGLLKFDILFYIDIFAVASGKFRIHLLLPEII